MGNESTVLGVCFLLRGFCKLICCRHHSQPLVQRNDVSSDSAFFAMIPVELELFRSLYSVEIPECSFIQSSV